MESCKEQKAIEIGDLSALDSRIKTKTLKMYKATMVSTQMNKTDKLQKHIEYFKVLDPESERLVLKHFNFASSVDQLRSENDYNAVCRNKKQSKSLKVRSLSSSSLSTGKVSNTIFESPISADLKERSGIECGQISDKSQLFYQQKNLSEQRKIMLDIARRRRKKILNNLQYLDLHTRLSTNDVPRSTSQCDGKRQFVPEHKQSVSVTRTTSSGDAINETYIFSHQPSQKQLDQILSTASSDDGKSFVSDDKKLTINTQNNGGLLDG